MRPAPIVMCNEICKSFLTVKVNLTFSKVEGGVTLLGCVEVTFGLARLRHEEAAILLLVHETSEQTNNL
jgi:hypothetical protein